MKNVTIPTGLQVFISREMNYVLIKCHNLKLGDVSETIEFVDDNTAIEFLNSFNRPEAIEWYLRSLINKFSGNLHLKTGKHE